MQCFSSLQSTSLTSTSQTAPAFSAASSVRLCSSVYGVLIMFLSMQLFGGPNPWWEWI